MRNSVKYSLVLGIALFIVNAEAQTVDQNYVKTYTAQQSVSGDLNSINDYKSVVQSVNYYDGVGRLVQTVNRNASPSAKDVIQPVSYNGLGRQVKHYMPYVDLQNLSGNRRSGALQNQQQFYDQHYGPLVGQYANDQTVFEFSELGRMVEQGAAGQASQVGNGHTLTTSYFSNVWNDEVILFKYNADSHTLTAKGMYQNYQLQKKAIKDESGTFIQEFTNKRGQVILRRVQEQESIDENTYVQGQWAETYYCYDVYGNLTVVLQPEGTLELVNEAGYPKVISDDLLQRWAFQYTYDGRNRIIEKQVPGAGKVIMIYDDRDRLVLTQDAEQRKDSVFSFTKYDHLNRPIMTGEKVINESVAVLRDELNGIDWLQEYDAFETLSGALFGYTSNSFPKEVSVDNIYTVTYYDNYNFKSSNGFESGFDYTCPTTAGQSSPQGTYYYESTVNNRVKGQVTGSLVRVLDSDSLIRSVSYYDERYRPIQVVTQNEFQGTIERTSTLYNFPGWVLATRRALEKDGNTFEIRQRYTYDHTGRLLKGYHQLLDNGQAQPEVLLAENRYNELGQLIEKNLHVENGVPQQSIDYSYHIRGWLEGVNTPDLLPEPEQGIPTDYFGMYLHYINENIATND